MVFIEIGGVFVNVAHIIQIYEYQSQVGEKRGYTVVTTTALDAPGENQELRTEEPKEELVERIRQEVARADRSAAEIKLLRNEFSFLEVSIREGLQK